MAADPTVSRCACSPDGPFCGACHYDEDGELVAARVHDPTVNDERFNASITYPGWGTVYMIDCHITEDGKTVVGLVEEDRMFGHPIYGTMNFPVGCIRRKDPYRGR